VRVSITNGGIKAWNFDAREQRLGFDDANGYEPLSVNTDRAKPPFTEVAPQETQVFDLYYDPMDHKGEADLPGFTFQWVIHTSDGPVGKKVTFVRGTTGSRATVGSDENTDTSRFYSDPGPWGNQWWDQAGRVSAKPFLHF
jgi:hypothetical protein